MNFTDVDDKTIARSREQFPDEEPAEALKQLTDHYSQVFLNDMNLIGNDLDSLSFVKATDNIDKMQSLISELHQQGFAYIAEDGVYFSIEAYTKSGKKYGQLTTITAKNTAQARIQNDEYDKDNVHDFALWKVQKPDEPAWDFELAGHNLNGRPGWHIECSTMSTDNLGQPFDIHTGGVDLIFPHHENEIAQSTAGKENPTYAKFFVHNEHLLVDGRKMSKSLNNFYTLRDVVEKGYDPLAFRLMVLQSHYRSQSNFTWENLDAAQNSLRNFQQWSDLQFQDQKSKRLKENYEKALSAIKAEFEDDLNTPGALAFLNGMVNSADELGPDSDSIAQAIDILDQIFGLKLSERADISAEQKEIIKEREVARNLKHWDKSDQLRDNLKEQGIEVRDTEHGPIWSRL